MQLAKIINILLTEVWCGPCMKEGCCAIPSSTVERFQVTDCFSSRSKLFHFQLYFCLKIMNM